MSNAIFPTFIGLGWSAPKTPQWNTRVQRAVSGKELRAAYQSRPIWKYGLTYEVLRGDAVNAEIQSLIGFFNARMGSYDSFLFRDPSDNSVTDQGIGVGDGTTTVFGLVRAYGGAVEPIGYADTSAFKVDGSTVTALTITDNHTTVTFTTAPAAGKLVTWTGTYYFRVRFDKDMAEFEQFMKDLWSLKKLELTGVI